MSFLKAEWRKLTIANYIIDPKVLEKYIPYQTELDLWNNNCYVSLVGFMFINTKLLGLPIPFHTNFEEVNLRFYVRHKSEGEWKRGVVFIKEIVPKPSLSFVANTIYGEHYVTMPMKHEWSILSNHQIVSYSWKCKNNWQKFTINADKSPSPIEPNSETEFITEHYWGYTKINTSKTFEYEVTHPTWKQYLVKDYEIIVDYGLVYGKDFAFLNGSKLSSVMLAEGSKITIKGKKKI